MSGCFGASEDVSAAHSPHQTPTTGRAQSMSTKSYTLLPAAACLLFSAGAIQTNNPPDQTGLAESAGANIRPSEQRPPASSNGRTTNESQPVVVTAAVSPPVIKRGGTATLTVRCQI